MRRIIDEHYDFNQRNPRMNRKTALATMLISVASIGRAAAQKRRVAQKPKPAATKPAENEDAAIAKIEKTGGSVRQIAQNDTHLEVDFHMAGATVNDAALVPLPALKNVIHLHLGKTGITDAGLAHVKPLTTLTELHLEETKITDKGLDQIKGLKGLTYLNLYGTAVTDAGLTHLTGLTNLAHLYVWQSKVTAAGADALKKALPKLDIVTGFDVAPAPAPVKK